MKGKNATVLFTYAPILLFAILAFSCIPKETVPSSDLPMPVTTQVTVKAPWEVEWAATLVKAKKESHLNIISSAPSTATREFIVDSMKNKFGIDIDLMAMRITESEAKIVRERKAGIFDVDALLQTIDVSFINYDKMGVLESLDKIIFLPHVLDDKVWRDGRLYLDKEHKAAGGFQGINPLITINKQLVKQDEIKSLDDLLDSRWKGKIIIDDPTVIGSGNATLRTILLVKGRDYLTKLVEQNPTVIRDRRQQTEWLARGKFSIGLGPSFGLIKDFIDTGAPLSYILPREGAFVTTSPGVVLLLKNAPHPNAARIFANWILTKEAQEAVARAQDTASRRLDVSSSHLVPQRQPQPGFKYIYDYETLPMVEELTNIIKEIFKPLM